MDMFGRTHSWLSQNHPLLLNPLQKKLPNLVVSGALILQKNKILLGTVSHLKN